MNYDFSLSLQCLYFQMSYFYSEEITYCECIMPREIGWEVINQLGQMQCVHFEQGQINYENPYVKSLKRCDEAIAKVNEIKNFINQIKPKFKLMKVNSYKDLLRQFNKDIKHQKIHGHLYINEIQDEIKNVHEYLSREKKQLQNMEKDIHQKLQDLALFITLSNSEDFKTISKQKSMLDGSNLFDFKCILINRKDQVNFQKSLFRVSRGNTWTKILNIDTERVKLAVNKQFPFLEQKVAIIIMFEFGQNNVLINKIGRFLACMETKNVTLAPHKWQAAIRQLQVQIKQIQNLQAMINDAIQRYLHKLYEPYGSTSISYLTYLQAYALKQRQIYRKLASTTQSKNFLHFNIFIPTKALPLKLNLSQKLPPLTLTPKQPTRQRPSKFDTNQILQIPQQILNTYGVPTYGQFNPSVLYVITFGFFIGVMFGDVGHMLMAIPFLVHFKVNKWAWTVILFMGYCGVIYNQFFGLNLGLFTSCYRFSHLIMGGPMAVAARDPDCVYPVGIDSSWRVAENQMQFTNSLKMKLAVILGVAHMLLGTSLRILNTVRKRNWLSLLTLAIPQLIFMLCTFFYMDFLIILKWLKNYSGVASKDAPSIIATMISVFAGFGDSPFLFWENQRKFQKFLVILAYSMIPIMLFGIPLGTYLKRKKVPLSRSIKNERQIGFNELIDQKIEPDVQNKTGSQDGMSDRNNNDKQNMNNKNYSYGDDHSHRQPMSEIFVHSFIQTIQYILGTVSNTASYLRLWALSLAHGQLSQVIFSLILKSMISGGYSTIVGAFLAFMFFYTVTFGVLICMDTMECFLHSLRLHWVQFQNKFYEGKGYKFQPFNFKLIYSK